MGEENGYTYTCYAVMFMVLSKDFVSPVVGSFVSGRYRHTGENYDRNCLTSSNLEQAPWQFLLYNRWCHTRDLDLASVLRS